MKLLRRNKDIKLVNNSQPPEETLPPAPKKERKSMKNKLPPDVYFDLIEPVEIKLNDAQSLMVSIKRGGEFGLPRVDIRLFVHTEVHEGYTHKGVTFNLDKLPELKSVLCDAIDEADEKGLFEEFKE